MRRSSTLDGCHDDSRSVIAALRSRLGAVIPKSRNEAVRPDGRHWVGRCSIVWTSWCGEAIDRAKLGAEKCKIYMSGPSPNFPKSRAADGEPVSEADLRMLMSSPWRHFCPSVMSDTARLPGKFVRQIWERRLYVQRYHATRRLRENRRILAYGLGPTAGKAV
ncbi:hypothetical protein MPH_03509 [Macrophomina phaseolina MS6]|uniref:Uncharacterized protein n=1 Tax=Macrophomina phaseolina (strain MS6) TaxID=1126212 RepID=K2S9M3_MACPH|nr:hypothetical protein MPH_03509 [Macrophomina phaseolina MS6]